MKDESRKEIPKSDIPAGRKPITGNLEPPVPVCVCLSIDRAACFPKAVAIYVWADLLAVDDILHAGSSQEIVDKFLSFLKDNKVYTIDTDKELDWYLSVAHEDWQLYAF